MKISASKAKAVVVGVVVADDDEQNGDFDDAGDSEDDVDIKAITTIISTTITINYVLPGNLPLTLLFVILVAVSMLMFLIIILV